MAAHYDFIEYPFVIDLKRTFWSHSTLPTTIEYIPADYFNDRSFRASDELIEILNELNIERCNYVICQALAGFDLNKIVIRFKNKEDMVKFKLKV